MGVFCSSVLWAGCLLEADECAELICYMYNELLGV